MAAAGAVFRQHRHEGLIEGALGEQAPHEVGDLVGEEEGIGAVRGAEDAGDDDVAGEAENTGHHGHCPGHPAGPQQAVAGAAG